MTEKQAQRMINGCAFAAECAVAIIEEELEPYLTNPDYKNEDLVTIGDAWEDYRSGAEVDLDSVEEVHCREEVYETFLQAALNLDAITTDGFCDGMNAFNSLYDYPLEEQSYEKFKDDLDKILRTIFVINNREESK